MRALAIGLALAAAPQAQAQAPRITAAQARSIIDGCARHAAAKRQSHAIAVVDEGGHLVALLRMDGNRAGIGAFAEQKAKAVAAWGFATSAMGEAAARTPGFDRAPSVVITPGGVPVFSADSAQLIGAVGVSGEAPADDAACAAAGITAAGLRAERAR